MKTDRGLSLVEVMVAMLLVLLATAGALELVARGRAAQRTGESLARLEETLDAAAVILADGIRIAGFLGLAPPSSPVDGAVVVGHPEPAGLEVAGGCVSGLAHDLAQPVVAVNGRYAATAVHPMACRPGPRGRHQPATDTLVLRHAAPQAALPSAGRLQLETSLRAARLEAGGINGLGDAARWHDLEVGIYYVSGDSTGREGWPSLRRKRLVGGARPAFQDEELVSGVSDLQLQLGIDVDGDGAVDRWIDPGAETPAGRLRALRLTLEAMSDLPEPLAAPGGRRKRASRVVELRNVSRT